MGADLFEYVVEYEQDFSAALGSLRMKVFESGEYRGAEGHPSDPEEAFVLSDGTGTASILDITKISDEPALRVASVLDEEELEYYFGTSQPTVSMVRNCQQLWDDIERGTARCIVCYDSGAPSKIVFVGYSFD